MTTQREQKNVHTVDEELLLVEVADVDVVDAVAEVEEAPEDNERGVGGPTTTFVSVEAGPVAVTVRYRV